MPVQLIPKQEEKEPILPNVLLYLSIIILIVAISSYFVLKNFLQKTENNIQSVKNQITQLNSSPQNNLKEEVLNDQKKINDFASLLNSQKYTSQVFPFIEKLTLPNVTFSSFDLKVSKNEVSVSGFADSFQTLGQQLLAFQNDPLVKSVALSGVSLGTKSGVPFTFDLILDPKVFQNSSSE